MGKLRALLIRQNIPIETCPTTGKRFKLDENGTRRYICHHDKRPSSCNTCLKNKYKPSKACSKCPCGSGVILRLCRNCDTPGAGTTYCKVTKRQKPRCPCGARTCGASLCEHNKLCCKECHPIAYLISKSRNSQYQALKETSKSKHTMEYVGMNALDYRVYIESTFQPGMTWGNYGRGKDKWGIGHRIPLMYTNPPIAEIKVRLHHENAFAQWNIDNGEQGNAVIFMKY